MPTTIKVWAHWTSGPTVAGQPPLPSTPFPAAFNAYPPGPTSVPKMSYQPKWPNSPGPVSEPVVGWCELARLAHVVAANFAGANFPSGPPLTPDEGYGSSAVDFKVSEIALHHFGNPGTDFVFTIASPTGTFSTTIVPTWPNKYVVALPNPVDGKGIWSITINRQAASSAAAPALLLQGPGGPLSVSVPYILPYVGQNEGVVLIEFTGEEIVCPTTKSLKAEKEVGATWSPIPAGPPTTTNAGACVDVGQKVRLIAEYKNPVPPNGTHYEWNFGDSGSQPADTLHPTSSQEHVYSDADAYAASVVLKLSTCQTSQTKIIYVCWNCPTSVSLKATTTGCAPTSGSVLLEVTVKWPAGPVPISVTYSWIINGPTGKFELETSVPSALSSNPLWKKTSAGAVTTGPVDLSQAGSYSASVALNIPNMKPGCTLGDALYPDFEIKGCAPCPTPTFTASPVQGCAPGSAVAILNIYLSWNPPTASPPNPVGYEWKITDPTGTRQATVTTTATTVKTDSSSPPWTGSLANANGTVDLDTPGKYDVEVTAVFGSGIVFDTSCSRKGLYSFTVPACPACPTVNSLSATPPSGPPPLNVNFQATVTNAGSIVPDANGNLYHWDFGDGATDHTTAPSNSHTYSSAGSFTAEVNVNVPPNCQATSAKATINTGKKNNGDGFLCGALLIAWMLLYIVGSLLLTVGIVNSNNGLIIAGVVVLIIAVIVFIIWLIICEPALCDVLKWLLVANFVVMFILGFLASCNAQYQIFFLIWAGIVLFLLIWILIRCGCDVLHWVVLLLTIAVAIYAGYYYAAVQIFAKLAGLTTIPAWLASVFKFLSSCPPNKVVIAAVTSLWATALIAWFLKGCFRELKLK